MVTAVGRHSADLPIGYQVPVDGSTSGQVFRTGTAMITDRFRYLIPAFTDLGERPAINAVRHSGAASLTVEVTVADDLVVNVVNVVDDGRGIPADNRRRSGLDNISRRAQQLGGTCELATPTTGGTHICWTVPLELET